MSTWYGMTYPENKSEMYDLLASQLAALMEGERDVIPNLANMSALIHQAMKEVNWTGFYLMKDGMLVLGPFQGNPACIRIPAGRGVCGTAAKTMETQLVPDVHLFPGHIACDAQSQSEIVIPLAKDGALLGVLDMDSPVKNRFDAQDRQGLENLCKMLVQGCDWPR